MCCMASYSYKSWRLSENCFIFLAIGTVKNNSNETKWQYLFGDYFIIGREDHVIMGRFFWFFIPPLVFWLRNIAALRCG